MSARNESGFSDGAERFVAAEADAGLRRKSVGLNLHVNVPELLAEMDLPNDPENRRAAILAIKRIAGELWPGARFRVTR